MAQKPLEMNCSLSYKYSQLSVSMDFTVVDLTNGDWEILGRKIAFVPSMFTDAFPCHYSLSCRITITLHMGICIALGII